jgi:dTDP-4-amino-4,6-dideoxygalactose transaminase
MNKYLIPFNKPFIVGKEIYYIAQSVLSGKIAGDGLFSKKCQKLIESSIHSKYVFLTHSCTASLEMAAILCDINRGDEVILPSFTFASTANAFLLRGANLTFVDIRKDTLNIDENKIERHISKNTKAIVPVHYAGVGCEMDAISSLAMKYRAYVIEDAAQGLMSKYNDQYLGTIGDVGTFSFHETKNVISGEGGAIVINNEEFVERAEIIREKGTNRTKFFRGEIDKYAWVDIGSSYIPSDIIAAFLYAQLENAEMINAKRKALYEYYYNELIELAQKEYIKLPYIPDHCTANGHIFYVITRNENTRDRLLTYLKKNGILAVFHYLPLHTSPIGLSLGYQKGDLPVTESVSSRLLRLPMFYNLLHEEQNIIIEKIFRFFA